MDRAVGVLHDVLDDQLLLFAETYLVGGLRGVRLLLLDESRTGGRGEQDGGGGEGRLGGGVGGDAAAGGQTGGEQGAGGDGGGDGQRGALVTRVEGGHTSSLMWGKCWGAVRRVGEEWHQGRVHVRSNA